MNTKTMEVETVNGKYFAGEFQHGSEYFCLGNVPKKTSQGVAMVWELQRHRPDLKNTGQLNAQWETVAAKITHNKRSHTVTAAWQ
jgi:hypothetical protein